MQYLNKKFVFHVKGIPGWCVLLFLAVIFQANAQKTITGTVYDTEGVPIGGVNVIVKGTSNGTTTDFDGKYQIRASDNAIIVFSYLGFKDSEARVRERSVINTTLTEDVQSLDEVVVIGYGTQRRQDVNGSVANIEAESLENIPQTSIDQFMQGRAAGVSINQNSGKPGSAVSVRIRGVTSIPTPLAWCGVSAAIPNAGTTIC